jgi:hypothetical protein
MLQTSSVSLAPAWIERRRSVRFPADDEAEVEIAGEPVVKLSGFLRDVSQHGVRLALPERVNSGAGVKIALAGGLELAGEIRYCRSAGAIYYAGVLIHQVRSTASHTPSLYSVLLPMDPPQEGEPQEHGNVRTSLSKL